MVIPSLREPLDPKYSKIVGEYTHPCDQENYPELTCYEGLFQKREFELNDCSE